ncbi:Yip1-domain family protein, partial [Blumeria hordei DH14]
MSAPRGEAGYDVEVDVDEDGDLGHTDLQEDLEFHSSNFNENATYSSRKPNGSGLPAPAT